MDSRGRSADYRAGSRCDRETAASSPISALYRDTLHSRDDDGLEAVLEKNYHTIKAQFLNVCAKLALQLYGHVSKEHFESLLNLKALYVLQVPGTPHRPDRDSADAERKYLDRALRRALTQISGTAQRERWPVLPVLQLYQYNGRFAHTLG